MGFYVGDQELGHVHATGHTDLHVPLEIHDALLDLGKCDHHLHLHLHDVSWITHRVDTADDVPEALWLLRLTASLYASVRDGDCLDEAALEALELPAALAEAAVSAFDRTVVAESRGRS